MAFRGGLGFRVRTATVRFSFARVFVKGFVGKLAVVAAVGVIAAVLPWSVPAGAWSNDGTWQADTVDNCGSILSLPSSLLGTVTGGGIETAFVAGGTSAVPVMSAGTGASTVAAGGALATGGTVAAMVGVGLLGFCGTFNGLNWATGGRFLSPVGYSGPTMQIKAGSCSTFEDDGYVPDSANPKGDVSQCVMFSHSSGATYLVLRQVDPSTGGWSAGNMTFGAWIAPGASVSVTGSTGDFSTPVLFDTSSGGEYFNPIGSTVVVEFDCRTETICAVEPHTDAATVTLAFRKYGASGEYTHKIPVDIPATRNGPIQRLWSRADCFYPGGAFAQVDWVGSWASARDSGGKVDVPKPECGSGGVPSKIEVFRQDLDLQYRSSSSLATMPDLDEVPLSGTSLTKQEVPAGWHTDPVLRDCYLSGFTNCDAAVSGDTVTVHNSTTNQTTNVTNVVNPTVTVGAAVAEVGGNLPEPDPDPDPTTTTTSPTTTTAVDQGTPDQPPPVAPPLPDEDGGGRFSSCVADLTDGAASGVTYNPITWVKAIVQWVWAPIFCAVWWLVVPAGGWAAIWGQLRDVWDNNEFLVGIRAIFGGLEFSGSCLPVDLRSSWSQSSVFEFDAGMCGSVWLAAVWFVLLGAGALGMVWDVFMTASTFQRRMTWADG